MTVKDRLHELVDELPEGLDELTPAEAEQLVDDLRRKLSRLHDELRRIELNVRARYGDDDRLGRRLLQAPVDDEPETGEEQRLVQCIGQRACVAAARRQGGVCAP
jgi:predicted nuclease with TOPRIM domain